MDLPIDYTNADRQTRRAARMQYVNEQGGKCMHCQAPLDELPPDSVTRKSINWKLFPPNFTKYPVHLQHCHKSGMTEGAVHAYCNAVLWQYHGR